MKPSINVNREGNLIQIFIPAQLSRQSGRKTILSPTGQPVNLDRNKEADTTLLNALVKAHRWNRWLVKGKYDSVKMIAADQGIGNPSYASRILRLTVLAPDIQEMILNGNHPPQLTLADFMVPFPHLWEYQRELFQMSA